MLKLKAFRRTQCAQAGSGSTASDDEEGLVAACATSERNSGRDSRRSFGITAAQAILVRRSSSAHAKANSLIRSEHKKLAYDGGKEATAASGEVNTFLES
uniref:Uncharacterized protein n=1 Tax=Plectus sambesii TaxID=2011161 RepID=A0A914XBP6_9BILA